MSMAMMPMKAGSMVAPQMAPSRERLMEPPPAAPPAGPTQTYTLQTEEDPYGWEYDEEDAPDLVEMHEICDKVLAGDTRTISRHDTPNDTWGVFIFVLCKDWSDLFNNKCDANQIIRMFFAFSAMFLNIALQFLFLHWVFSKIVQPAVYDIQKLYGQFRQDCFTTAGVFNETAWANFDRETICESGIANPGFIAGILFLWTMQILAEFRQNFDLNRHVYSLPSLPSGILHSDQVIELAGDGLQEFMLVALSTQTRIALYVAVIIPKYIIMTVLLFIGYRWLAASAGESDIILNTLALIFIPQIDELIFSAVFPERLKDNVSRFKICVPRIDFEGLTPEEKKAVHYRTTLIFYGRSILLVFMAILILVLYIYLGETTFLMPGYNSDLTQKCEAVGLHVPKCTPNMRSPNGIACFPYGTAGVYKPEV